MDDDTGRIGGRDDGPRGCLPGAGRSAALPEGRRRRLAAVGAVLAAVVVAACSACGASGSVAAGSSPTTTEAPKPAGRNPSPIATLPCHRKAGVEIADALGVTAAVGSRTWVDHQYSCVYGYPNGSFSLSIKELSSWSQTLGYFHSLGQQMGDTRSLENLGQGAFQTTDGSVVVRKDWKVLLVDVADLPSQFGVPPTSAGDIGVTVADVILGCWDGD